MWLKCAKQISLTDEFFNEKKWDAAEDHSLGSLLNFIKALPTPTILIKMLLISSISGLRKTLIIRKLEDEIWGFPSSFSSVIFSSY